MLTAAIIQAIAAVILVGVTGFYVWLTRQTLLEMKEARAAEVAPYVVAFFDTPEDMWVELVVKNIGKTPAYDVSIVVDPVTPAMAKIPVISSGAPSIPPGYEIRSWVAMLNHYLESNDPLTLRATISYRGESGPKSSEQVLDLSVHKQRLSIGRMNIHNVAENLVNIKKQLEAMTTVIDKEHQ